MTLTPSKGLPTAFVVFFGATLLLVNAIGPCLAAESSSGASFFSAETSSLLSAIIKVSGSLMVVVGIMLVLLYAIKRAGFGSGRGSSAITVLETRMVAPKKYIAIVDVAGHCLALGITDHTITILSDLGPETKAALSTRPAAAATGFAGLLKKSMSTQQTATVQGENNAESNPTTKQVLP